MYKKLPAPSRFVQRDIGVNGQTAKAVWVFERGPHKVRITVCSDSVESQCFARAEVFTSAMQWSVVSFLQRSQMKTPMSLAYRLPAPVFAFFEEDYFTLLGQVDVLLGITQDSLPRENFALVFLDADVDDSIDDALIGPTFFPDEQSALLKVGGYVARKASQEPELGRMIANHLGAATQASAALDESWFVAWFEQLSCDQLASVIEAFFEHRSRSGRIAFYRTERAK